jgi:hypothetical protein
MRPTSPFAFLFLPAAARLPGLLLALLRPARS